MHSISLIEAQKHLSELVLKLDTEGEFLILDANVPVAKLSPVHSEAPVHSLRDHQPTSAGALLQPYPTAEDDFLDEMRST